MSPSVVRNPEWISLGWPKKTGICFSRLMVGIEYRGLAMLIFKSADKFTGPFVNLSGCAEKSTSLDPILFRPSSLVRGHREKWEGPNKYF